jgi:Tfp pilus assembly protein PilO
MKIIDDLQSLDTNDPGRWPLPFRIAAVALVFVAVLAGGIYMLVIKLRNANLRAGTTRRS